MKWYWAWGGKCIGYRIGENLYASNGRHLGRFVEKDVFALDGRYLGEEIEDGRLIVNPNKKGNRIGSFSPAPRQGTFAPMAAYVPNVMYAGYEDFPSL
jgi:hypothetical protein